MGFDMRYKFTLVPVILLSVLVGGSLSADLGAASDLFPGETARTELRARLQEAFAKMEVSAFEGEQPVSGPAKSVAKSVLFSAAVPGTGQFYTGSYIQGAAFFVFEIASIFAQVRFNNKANDFEDQFQTLADAQWNEDAYWDWMAQVSNLDRNNLDALRSWESDNFSHFLPENKNQQYYENVGKYNQFLMGWRDFREDILGSEVFTMETYLSNEFRGQDLRRISPTRNDYTLLRKDSNDNFKRATTFATLMLLNHVVSAIDAGFTTRHFNRKMTASLGVSGLPYENTIVPALALGVTW